MVDYKKIAQEVMQNYPEYSSEWLRCSSWKYDEGAEDCKGVYKFIAFDGKTDGDNIKEVTVTAESVVKSVEWFAVQHVTNKLSYYGFVFNDECTYDAYVLDAIVQHSLWGEIVYG